ncbi:MAG: hypothetical protein ISP64_00570 [Flavobacteriaceae bacterium]|jgi:hypothetical protein|nr:hypothetical protein [Flavobacteriaceae bacterium]|tara:strand:- start:386 stop:1156 length:771 start_codon:yes stop_codon:yes gene_type:complete
MRKLYFTITLLICGLSLQAQIFTQIEEVTLKDGVENDYEAFESFWGVVKDKAIADGHQTGWFVWKVDPQSNDNNAWADYLIINVFKDKAQMEALNSKSPDWWSNYIKMAHKGKTKNKVIKAYVAETMNNKYRKKSVTYTNKRISDYMMPGVTASKGTVGYYLGLEQLNEDYVPFELNYFKSTHEGRREWWELNSIDSRTENAYKPVSHIIFEIPKVDAPEIKEEDVSFTDKMMNKYGQTTRKLHGWLQAELVLWEM